MADVFHATTLKKIGRTQMSKHLIWQYIFFFNSHLTPYDMVVSNV